MIKNILLLVGLVGVMVAQGQTTQTGQTAQTGPATQTGELSGKLLSFDQALSRTMTENPQIKAHEFEQKVAEQERKAAFGLRLPQISAAGSYVHMGKDIRFDLNGVKKPIGDLVGGLVHEGVLPPAALELAAPLLGLDWGMTLQDKDMAFAGGTVVMPIYTGGKINAANNAAKINERTAAKSGDQMRGGLVSELVERYYGLVLANQVVAVREQVLEGMKVHLADAKALESNGVIAKGERLYAEVKVAEAERELLNARLQRQTISAALNNTMGESGEPIDGYTAKGPVFAIRDYVPVSAMFIPERIESMDYFKTLARSGNPMVEQVTLKKELAEQGVKLERSEFLPQIALMGGGSFYNYQVSHLVPRWTVGAGVKLKIFDGLSREYKYSAAKNRVRQVDAVKVYAENSITLLVEKLYNEMSNYNDQISSIDVSMEFAQEYLRIKQAAFKEGMASSVDVIDAQLNLASTRTHRLQSAYYYDLMLARLLEAAGVSERFGEYATSENVKIIKTEK